MTCRCQYGAADQASMVWFDVHILPRHPSTCIPTTASWDTRRIVSALFDVTMARSGVILTPFQLLVLE